MMEPIGSNQSESMVDSVKNPVCSETEWIATLRALAERPRLRIVRTLLEGPMCVSDISEAIGAKIYNTSRHLKTLREAGLLTSTRHGAQILFDLSPNLRENLDDSRQRLDMGFCLLDFSCLKRDEEPTAP